MTCPGGHILFAHVKLAAAELHACVNLQKLYLAKKDHWSATRVTPQAGREPMQSEIRSLSSLQCRQAGAVQSQRPPAHLPCAAVRAFRTSGGAVFRALEEAFGVRMHKLCEDNLFWSAKAGETLRISANPQDDGHSLRKHRLYSRLDKAHPTMQHYVIKNSHNVAWQQRISTLN